MPNVAAPIFRRIIRTLADVTHYADHGDPILESCARDCADLLTCLKPRKAPAKTLPGKSRSVMRREKHQKHAQATAAIREAVATRAGGQCECCTTEVGPFELDHWEGGSGRRRARQSTANTWLLCSWCHRLRSRNQPTAAYWNQKFQAHCDAYGLRFTPHIER